MACNCTVDNPYHNHYCPDVIQHIVSLFRKPLYLIYGIQTSLRTLDHMYPLLTIELTVGIVGIVVTIISIIVTVISILQNGTDRKSGHQKSNRPRQD